MEAVIFIGVQGSGKTTFYRERFFDTHLRLSLDVLRTRTRERLLLEACLAAQQPFVIDNTNPRPEDRAPYIGLARPRGFRVVGVYFECSLGQALGRNRARSGRARIPDGGVIATFRRLRPPTAEEGFDQLQTVRLDPEGRLVVASSG